MCDQAKLRQWAASMNRREIGTLATFATLAACTGGGGAARESGQTPLELSERGVTFSTADGVMDAFFVHPAEGRHPGVIFWPDIASLRESKRNMARRLAGEGYAVLVLNPYYRDVAGEQFADFASFIEADGFAKVGPWRGKLDRAAIGRDAQAATAWLDAQEAVDTVRGIGTQGYCMGGPFTIWSAAAVPDRIKAAASFHGGGLVRSDNPDSPHRLFDAIEAALLIAIAQDDHAEAPEAMPTLREAAQEAGLDAEIAVYEGDHGWTVPDSPAYARAAAERAYEDLLALYAAHL